MSKPNPLAAERALNRNLIRQNEALSAQMEKLLEQNNRMMLQSLTTTSCMVWVHGKEQEDGSRSLAIPREVIQNEAPLLKVAARNNKKGGREFFVTKLTQEEVEKIRQDRLNKIRGVDNGPKIITPG